MRRFLSMAVCAILFAACGKDEPTGTNRVAGVVILVNGSPAPSTLDVDFIGGMDVGAVALNASHVELPGGTYNISWNSDDASVASVIQGHVETVRNGTARIIATSGIFADTLVLNIVQMPTKAEITQDTIVAFIPGATKLSGASIDATIQQPDTVRFSARTVDRKGTPAASTNPIQYTNVDPSIFRIFPNTKGDTVRIIGVTTGTGRILYRFLDFSDTVRVQVVSSYAVVQMIQGLGAASVSPDIVTIPAGAAVLFQNTLEPGSNFQVLGTGWHVGPVPGRQREGNVFNVPGSYDYLMSNAHGTVVVTP